MDGLFGAIAFLGIIAFGIFIGNDANKTLLTDATGKTITEIQKLKQDCEYNLPRNRECKVVISYVTQEKK